MKTEVSAGGVVVRKRGSVWQVLVLTDMKGNRTFPKGLIEEGEEPVDAASREVREETGVGSLTFLSKLNPVTYLYTRGTLIKKTVRYFLFRSPGTELLVPQSAEGIREVVWMPIEDALTTIGYPKTNKPLITEAKRKLIRNLASHRPV